MGKSGKSVFLLPFVCIIVLLLSAGTFSQVLSEEELAKLTDKYPGTSNEYTGILVVDRDGDGRDELICDFGSIGIWYYDRASGWSKANNNDPEWMIHFEWGTGTYILADFGSLGLWQGYGSGTNFSWTKENNHNAHGGFALDDDDDGNDEVYVDFGSIGLWRYDWDTFTWTRINKRDASYFLRGDLWAVGYEEGNFTFSGIGFWNVYWSGGGPFWSKLNNNGSGADNTSADYDGDGTTAEELIVDFMSLGTWLYDGSSWHKLHNSGLYDSKPVKFMGAADYELLATLNNKTGLYWWNEAGYPGTWTKINNNSPASDEAFCEPYDPNGNTEGNSDEEVATDFGTLGLWQFDYTTGNWTKINSNSPDRMIKADIWGDGYSTSLICDFGSLGLWIYDGRYSHWYKINKHNVEQY